MLPEYGGHRTYVQKLRGHFPFFLSGSVRGRKTCSCCGIRSCLLDMQCGKEGRLHCQMKGSEGLFLIHALVMQAWDLHGNQL